MNSVRTHPLRNAAPRARRCCRTFRLLPNWVMTGSISHGLEPVCSTSEEFALVISRDYLRWQQFIKEIGAIPEAQ